MKYLPVSESDIGKNFLFVYFGGSKPGTIRHLTPQAVGKKGLVCIDHKLNISKDYAVSLLYKCPSDGVDNWFLPYESLELKMEKSIKENLVDLANNFVIPDLELILEDTTIGYRKKGKHGKYLKYPFMGLYYRRMQSFQIYNPETDEIEEGEKVSTRPYGVFSEKIKVTRSFADIHQAFGAFIFELFQFTYPDDIHL